MNISRKQFIKELVVYVLCLSPIGTWLYKKWSNRKRRYLDSGYIYAPYIPLVYGPIVYSDVNGNSRLNSKYYEKVIIDV